MLWQVSFNNLPHANNWIDDFANEGGFGCSKTRVSSKGSFWLSYIFCEFLCWESLDTVYILIFSRPASVSHAETN